MRVIIEGFNYRSESVREILHELSPLENVEGAVSVSYVGYYYNARLRDCVFILPKVLLDEQDRVFSRLDPHDIINLDDSDLLKPEERSFIYDFAVWIYRAIVVYNNSNPKNDIVYRRKIAEMGKGRRMLSNTFLDILLTLLRFNKEQQHFFTSTLRNIHSGHNKINWTRTIAHSTAWIQKGSPIYLDPINKKRQVDTDEELIIIYLSILHYISDTYGFPVEIAFGYELIKGRKFDHYLSGYGVRRLKQIKYRYFSDIQLRLWEMCYAFFDRAHRINIVAEQREYLLVKSFNIVFEAIIDELIGDKEPPRGLKDQGDGKRVDHIYSYQSLTNNEDDKPIYYIGDSKYYKIGNRISSESVYKQFTYARNVIQWNINLFLDDSADHTALRAHSPKYRDDQTEGYNIVPNFFISAKMDEHLSYADNVSTTDRENNTFISRHFNNRLFDRDTLLVYHYDVNFLYVVSLYARENNYQKSVWKKKVRSLFREKIQSALQEQYDFYAMRAKLGVHNEEYLRVHFQELLGKVYRPFSDPRYLSLALDHKETEANEQLLAKLRQDYYVEPCALGTNPQRALSVSVASEVVPGLSARQGVLAVMMYQDRLHKFLNSGEIAIGIKTTKAGMEIIRHLDDIRYLLFHTRRDEGQVLFEITATPQLLNSSDIEGFPGLYLNMKHCPLYLLVQFDLDKRVPTTHIHSSYLEFADNTERYDPSYCQIADLIDTDKG